MQRDSHHGQDVPKVSEGRAASRLPVNSLAYIELSDENAGLILNISETGIAVQMVQVLTSNEFRRVRFRLPGTAIPIEAAGRMVWQIRSKKEAGIEFSGLSDATRTHIRNWIAAEPSRVAAAMTRAQTRRDPGGGAEPPSPLADGLPALTRPTQPLTSAVLPSTSTPPTTADESGKPKFPARSPYYTDLRSRSRGPALSDAHHASPSALPLSRPSTPAGPPKHRRLTEDPAGYSGGTGPSGRPLFRTDPALSSMALPGRPHSMAQPSGHPAPAIARESSNPRPWWTYTAALGLAAVLTFAGLMMFHPDSITRLRMEALTQPGGIRVNGKERARPEQGKATSHGRSAPSSLTNKTSKLYPSQPEPTAKFRAGGPPVGRPQAAAGPRASTTQRGSADPPTGNQGSKQIGQAQTTVSQAPGSAAASPSRPTNQAPQQNADASARPGPNASTTGAALQPAVSSLELSGSQRSPLAQSVPLTGVGSGSVATTSQFHALRVLPETQSSRSRLIGNLQMGQLISSAAPAYPIEAAREGIEGTVKLDVIVGQDGTVQSVQVLSGAPLLASAATRAVREWRYGETLLAGKPIETEQYVTLIFRLAK